MSPMIEADRDDRDGRDGAIAHQMLRETRRVQRVDPAQIRALVEAELDDARLSSRTVQLSPLASLHELAMTYVLVRQGGSRFGRGRRSAVRLAESSLRSALIPIGPASSRQDRAAAGPRPRWWSSLFGWFSARVRRSAARTEGRHGRS